MQNTMAQTWGLRYWKGYFWLHIMWSHWKTGEWNSIRTVDRRYATLEGALRQFKGVDGVVMIFPPGDG